MPCLKDMWNLDLRLHWTSSWYSLQVFCSVSQLTHDMNIFPLHEWVEFSQYTGFSHMIHSYGAHDLVFSTWVRFMSLWYWISQWKLTIFIYGSDNRVHNIPVKIAVHYGNGEIDRSTNYKTEFPTKLELIIL